MNENKRSRLALFSWVMTLSITTLGGALGCQGAQEHRHVATTAHVRAPAPAQVLDPSEVLRELLTDHPSLQVSRDFYTDIEMGRVPWAWTTAPGHVAEFSVVPKKFVVATESGEPWIDEQPVLFISRELLAPENRSFAQLVLYHEYQHFLQWKRVEFAHETFVFGFDRWTKDLCKQSRQAEISAYQLECAFAREHGMAAVYELCTLEGVLFEEALNRMLDNDPARAKCRF